MAIALRKMVIPALNYVTPEQMIEPVRKFKARLIETEQQRHKLIAELSDERTYGAVGSTYSKYNFKTRHRPVSCRTMTWSKNSRRIDPIIRST
jgi:hypothetical protein